jgi:hypothetical protein
VPGAVIPSRCATRIDRDPSSLSELERVRGLAKDAAASGARLSVGVWLHQMRKVVDEPQLASRDDSSFIIDHGVPVVGFHKGEVKEEIAASTSSSSEPSARADYCGLSLTAGNRGCRARLQRRIVRVGTATSWRSASLRSPTPACSTGPLPATRGLSARPPTSSHSGAPTRSRSCSTAA